MIFIRIEGLHRRFVEPKSKSHDEEVAMGINLDLRPSSRRHVHPKSELPCTEQQLQPGFSAAEYLFSLPPLFTFSDQARRKLTWRMLRSANLSPILRACPL